MPETRWPMRAGESWIQRCQVWPADYWDTQIIALGFYPFWFWNDRLTEAEVRWQIREMADKGIRGFFIHSRQGLGQPYLSEAFLDAVEVAIEAAAEHGLLVHLYDEYPYPSGVATLYSAA